MADAHLWLLYTAGTTHWGSGGRPSSGHVERLGRPKGEHVANAPLLQGHLPVTQVLERQQRDAHDAPATPVLQVAQRKEGPDAKSGHALHVHGVAEVHDRDSHIVGGKVELVKLLVVVLLSFLSGKASCAQMALVGHAGGLSLLVHLGVISEKRLVRKTSVALRALNPRGLRSRRRHVVRQVHSWRSWRPLNFSAR